MKSEQCTEILPVQCRMARAALGLGVRELAAVSDVSTDTITRFEKGELLPRRTVDALRSALETAGVLFIPEDLHGPGVRLLRTTAFEEALASLVYTHGNDVDLGRVEAIVAGLSDEDRDALALVFGNRVWGRQNLPSDERGREIQHRLMRTGDFYPSRKGHSDLDADGTLDG